MAQDPGFLTTFLGTRIPWNENAFARQFVSHSEAMRFLNISVEHVVGYTSMVKLTVE